MSIQHGDKVMISGEAWTVLAVGASEPGCVYLHVKSETRGTRGKAGFIPLQQCGWFDGQALREAPCR